MNIKFKYPDDYFQFNTIKTKSIDNDLSPEEIEKFIEEGISFLEENKDVQFYRTSTGNTIVIILNYKNEKYPYEIIVAKNYWRKDTKIYDEQ